MEESILRRFLGHPLVRLVGEVCLFLAAGTAFSLATRGFTLPREAGAWIVLGLLIAAVAFAERFTVGRGLGEVGFAAHYAVRDLLLGAVIGFALFSLVILELVAAGSYHVTAVHPSPALMSAALILIPAAAVEEVLLRGIVFRLMSEWAGTWVALAVSAVLFGMLHAFNPGASWFSTVAIALEAGILLAAAYVATGNLWLPIALHFAWNFCEGPLYGTPLSGVSLAQPLLSSTIAGPTMLGGGSFGPEAGLPALFTCLLAAAAFLAYAYKRGRIVPNRWRRRAAPSSGP